MGKWEMVRLGDVCDIVSGSTPSTSNPALWNGGIKWVTPAELSDDSYFVHDTERYISETAGLKSMPAGTVLLSSRAPIGKVAIAAVPMCCNQGFKNLICTERVHNRCLYRWLRNQTAYLNSLGRGATFKEVSRQIVADVEIPLPPLDVQKKIADILDRAAALIETRKAQIAKLDLLVKSRFVEMFGNPAMSEFKYCRLSDIVSNDRYSLKRGPFGGSLKKDDFVTRGFLVYEQRHAIHNDFDYEKYYIDESKYNEMEAFQVSDGDLIVSCSGVTLGRIAEIPQNAKRGIINQALLKISLNTELINNEYFMTLFKSDYTQDKLFGFCRGSGIPNFPSMSEVKTLLFPIPPISLQNLFAQYTQAINKSRFDMQRGLSKLELMYKSLMQKCFNGELI